MHNAANAETILPADPVADMRARIALLVSSALSAATHAENASLMLHAGREKRQAGSVLRLGLHLGEAATCLRVAHMIGSDLELDGIAWMHAAKPTRRTIARAFDLLHAVTIEIDRAELDPVSTRRLVDCLAEVRGLLLNR